MAPRMPRLCLLALVASLLASPVLAVDTHEPRVETARYVLGPGDAGCLGLGGPGCVRFLTQAHETQVLITIDDDVHDPVAADLCGTDCRLDSICGSGTLDGLEGGEEVYVLINVATGWDTCEVLDLGAGFAGTVTAVFS